MATIGRWTILKRALQEINRLQKAEGKIQQVCHLKTCHRTSCITYHGQRRQIHHVSRSINNTHHKWETTPVNQGIHHVTIVPSRNQSSVPVKRILDEWEDRMIKEGIPEPRQSVELIVAHAFGKKMIHDVDLSVKPTSGMLENIEKMCNQRLTRCPVQYIIGEWDFFDMTLEMRRPVLIPRPETENLADLILKDWVRADNHRGGTFLEIGCGTGAVSIYLLKHLPLFTAVAMDINPVACQLTENNATRHGVSHRLNIVEGDIFYETDISKVRTGSFDFIVSNPPYITDEEMKNLEPEIHSYEDHVALIGGSDGLNVIKQILAVSSSLLKPHIGELWIEVGLSHPKMIKKLLERNPEYGLTYLETMKDFTDRGRFCKIQARQN